MENSRLLIATFLSAVVLLIWGIYMQPAPVKPPADGQALENQTLEQTADPENGGPSGAASSDAATSGPASESTLADGTLSGSPASAETDSEASSELQEASVLDFGDDTVVGISEQVVRVETQLAFVEWTNRGAQLTSYRLKKQLDSRGQPLDLVRQRGNDMYPFALMAGAQGNERGSTLNQALWQHEVTEEGDVQVVRFRHRSDQGAAEKIFRFDTSGFLDVEIRVDRPRQWSVLLGPGVGDEGSKFYGQLVDRAVGYRQGSDAELLEAKGMDEDPVFFGARGLDWISLEDNYFLVAIVPVSGIVEAMVMPVLEREEVLPERPRFLPVDTSASDDELVQEQAILLRSGGAVMQMRTYFGSKRYSVLAALPYQLEETVRFGSIMGLLSKPLYHVLQFLHANVVDNYGWCIVLTTLLIRLVFFPLTHKGQKSMTKMQELNPKVQAIRAKYKPKMRDKQGRPNVEAQRQMNEEVMALYKTAGVNPAGGCLPILLQMPVFFAFYRLLYAAVELRGAEWILWIDDLSATDPLYILPVLMGVTSIAMQRMQPASPDPMQRRLMQIMPLGFAVFAFFFPAGLVLYWLTNNLISMLQQYFINGPRQRAAKAKSGSDSKSDSKSKKGRHAAVLAD